MLFPKKTSPSQYWLSFAYSWKIGNCAIIRILMLPLISPFHCSFDRKKTSPFETEDSSINRILLINLWYSQGYSILNTWSSHSMKYKITWHNPDNVTKKIISSNISDSWRGQFVIYVNIYNRYFESDPKLFVTKLTTSANIITRFHLNKPRKTISYKHRSP